MTPATPHPILPPQAVEGEFAVGSILITGVTATDREDWK